jgi:hypothetical protein
MKNKFSIALTLAVILAVLLTSLALADGTPTITSDLPDYAPGQTVNLFGAGWQAGEAVHIFVNDSAGSSWSRDGYVVAADDGTFIDTFQLPNWFVATYSVTATGTSGTANTTFTDGNLKFVETGLPSGTLWSVTWGVTTLTSTTDTITFGGQEEGPFNYTIPSVGGYAASPASGSATRPGQGTTTVNITFAVSDTTAPTAFPTQSPAANANGWNNSDVTVTWNWADNPGGSGIDSAHCTTSSTSSGEGTIELTATCKDLAGNEGSASYTVYVDKTAPTASASASPAANANGWNNTDVTVSFSGDDGTGSGIDFCSDNIVLGNEGDGQSASGTCTDKAGNVSAAATASNINIDKTAPTASASVSPAANANGWNNTDVTVSFSGNDGLSSIDFCDADVVLNTEGSDQSASGYCYDKAGNKSNEAGVTGINIDKTAPTVSLVGGPADGMSYYFGFLPAAPTCSASDALSGLDGACSVSAYDTTVGNHTVTATATDKAGNSASTSATYTVLAWTLKGFYQPVDMNGVFNVAKNGSTIPFKFEIFAGSTELTDVADVASFKYGPVACSATAPNDTIETTATGGTSLRYDTVAGQFVYNWKTPSSVGCYSVTMTTLDGSSLTAYFRLK